VSYLSIMFVRFRESTNHRWLRLNLIEAYWDNGTHQRHLGSLGTIELPATAARRLGFWLRLTERIAELSDRIDADAIQKIVAAIEGRVPRPTLEEQSAVLGIEFHHRAVAGDGGGQVTLAGT
jgi:hypothetical protein